MNNGPCVEKRPDFDAFIDEIYSGIIRISELRHSLSARVDRLDGNNYPKTATHEKSEERKSPSCVSEHLIEIKLQLNAIGDELNTINQRLVSQVG